MNKYNDRAADTNRFSQGREDNKDWKWPLYKV